MAKTRGARLPWDARAAEVLAGRTRIDASALIELINEVNPTGRGRDAAESAARYALKARLASLLVTRFPEELSVVEEPDHPGVVSLRRRAAAAQACHAVLSALDDEARSWVRFQLDAGGAPDSEAGPLRDDEEGGDEAGDEGSDDPEALLAAAAAAAEAEYDFERAERLYRRALSLRADAGTAAALLRFLVDALAADGEALAVEEALPAAVRGARGVRVLLAIAAARSGDEARALGLLARLAEPRAAEAWVVLARGALGRGEGSTAAEHLREAAAADPASPEVRALAEELARREAAERAPEEAELGRLLGEGREAEAGAKAAAILARWPASEAARRAAQAVEGRRQAAEGRRLVAEAEAARRHGELAGARGLLQKALAGALAEPERGAARRALEEVAAEEREREAAGRVEQVMAALADRARGLGVFAELEEGLRARVLSRAKLPEPGWIDAMIRAGARPRAALDAALALSRAGAVVEGDPGGALSLLSPHRRALEHVGAAGALEARAHALLVEGRRRRAGDELRAAEEALAVGDVERSERLLAAAEDDLGEAEAGRAAALRAQLEARAELRRLAAKVQQARSRRRYAEARRLADELAARAEGAERARWEEEARAHAAEIRREHRLRVFEPGEAAAGDARGVYLSTYPHQIAPMVDLHAGLVFVPASRARELFVHAFALDCGRLVRAFHLRTPDDSCEPRVVLSGSRLLVIGGEGVLELAPATGEPLRYTALRDPRHPSKLLMSAAQPIPQGRSLWVHDDEEWAEIAVVDPDGERPRRPIPDADAFHLLPGVVPPRVAVLRERYDDDDVLRVSLSLHEPSGAQVERWGFPRVVHGVVPHPAGEGLVIIREVPSEDPGERVVAWSELSRAGELLRTEPIAHGPAYNTVLVTVARDEGMVFLVLNASAQAKTHTLVALRRAPGAPSPPCLEEAYRVEIGEGRLLTADPDGRRAILLGEREGELEVIPLGPQPPALAERLAPGDYRMPYAGLLDDCQLISGERSSNAVSRFAERYKWHPVVEVRRLAAEDRAAMGDDRVALVGHFWSLISTQDPEGAAAHAARLAERWPDDPEVRHATWTALAAERRWADLLAKLGPLDPAPLSAEARQHRLHLLAAASLVLGDPQAAATYLGEATAIEGTCKLGPLSEALEASSAAWLDEDLSSLSAAAQMVSLIRSADRLLARGDHASVIALAEYDVLWLHDEVQSLARLAEARLAVPSRSPRERLRKALLLARFLGSLGDVRVHFRVEVIVPGAVWPEARLAELAGRARAWLDGDEP